MKDTKWSKVKNLFHSLDTDLTPKDREAFLEQVYFYFMLDAPHRVLDLFRENVQKKKEQYKEY